MRLRLKHGSSWQPERWRDEPFAAFVAMWEFWVGYALFYVIAVFFPWQWLAQTGMFDWFVDMMSMAVASIKGLPDAARHRPRPASELQLSFIHFVLITFVVIKVIRQKPHPSWRELAGWRLAGGMCAMTIVIPFSIALALLWEGQDHGAENPGEVLHGNQYQVVIAHTMLWLVVSVFGSVAKITVYEIIRRSTKKDQ